MLRYMLDTDICSYVMKRSNALLLKRLQKVPVNRCVPLGNHENVNCCMVFADDRRLTVI
jgi:hypothetical protein